MYRYEFTYGVGQSFIIFDPPTALTPAARMVPPSASPPEPTPPATPADPTTMPGPRATLTTDFAKPASSLTIPRASSTYGGDQRGGRRTAKPDPVQPSSQEAGSPPPGSQVVSVELNSFSIEDQNSSSGAAKASSFNPQEFADPALHHVDNIQPGNQGLGAIIYNAFGKPGNEASEGIGNINTIIVSSAGIPEVNIGDNQTLIVGPSGVQTSGTTYSVGALPMTLNGNVFTLVRQPTQDDSHGSNPAGSPSDPPNNAQHPPRVVTIADQPITLNASPLLVAGSILQPGNHPITISDTPLSLASNGVLIYGPSSVLLSSQSILTLGSQTFTPNPKGFAINSTSIYPGEAAQTIDGTVVSLDQSGHLTIGNTIISLPIPVMDPPTSHGIVIAGHTITPEYSRFGIEGTSISVGGPTITLNGTVISLQTSGILVVGTSKIRLSAPLVSSSPTYGVDGFSVQALPSSLALVDGVTFTPSQAGTTIAGSLVSLEEGGYTLDVGSTKLAMPTGGVNRTGAVVAFEGGQVGNKASRVSMFLAVMGWAFSMLIL